MNPAVSLLAALALTELIEVPLGLAFFRERRAVLPLFLVNLLTNPLLNAILSAVTFLSPYAALRTAVLVLSEIAVVPAEGVLLHAMLGCPRRKAFLVSLFTNAASFTVGLLIFPQGG